MSVLGIQHDSQYFPEPEIFDPERFTEENKGSRQKYTYIPFGEGLRMCIGNIILSILNYEIVDFKNVRVKFTNLLLQTENALYVIHCNKLGYVKLNCTDICVVSVT